MFPLQKEGRARILAELRKVIIGQDKVIEQLLTCVFGRGHALLMGVPLPRLVPVRLAGALARLAWPPGCPAVALGQCGVVGERVVAREARRELHAPRRRRAEVVRQQLLCLRRIRARRDTKIQAETLQWIDDTLPKLDKQRPTVIFTHFPLGMLTPSRPRNAVASARLRR